VLLASIVAFSIARPETYATSTNFQAILQNQSVNAVLAFALVVPLVAKRFDLSVGAVAGLTGVAAASAMEHGASLFVAILIAPTIGIVIGAINGFLVARLGVNSLIATIGTSTVVGGAVQAYTKGVPISSGLSPTLTDLSGQRAAGLPALFIIMILIGVVVWYVLRQTPYGRELESVGSNADSARLVGISVERVVLTSFMLSALLASIAGLLIVARQGSANPATAGGVEAMLPALAAVFLGATSIRPGFYNVVGTLVGLYLVGSTVSGLTLLGAAPWVEPVFNGSIIVVAVALSTYIGRRRTGVVEIGQ
jgi:ribose transport system permease protein